MILGGFATDKDLFMELYYLYITINEIDSKSFAKKNNLLLLLDPYHKSDTLNYGINTYEWNLDDINNVMGYKEIPFELSDTKINGISLHSNLSSPYELIYHIGNSDFSENSNYKEIVEVIRKSVDEDLRLLPNTANNLRNTNLFYIKKQLMTIDKFLAVLENSLNDEIFNSDLMILLPQIDYLISDITNIFQNEQIQKACLQEFKEHKILESLTSLLDIQVKLTEKINKLNL